MWPFGLYHQPNRAEQLSWVGVCSIKGKKKIKNKTSFARCLIETEAEGGGALRCVSGSRRKEPLRGTSPCLLTGGLDLSGDC